MRQILSRLSAMPLAWLSALFLAGLAVSTGLPKTSYGMWAAAAVTFSLAGIFVEKPLARKKLGRLSVLPFSPFPLLILAGAFCLGIGIYQKSQPNLTSVDLAWYNGRGQVEVTGWVTELPDEREKYTLLTVEAESIRLPTAPTPRAVAGRLLVRAGDVAGMSYGDRLILSGRLSEPPTAEDFSYRDYLARQGVYSWMVGAKITPVDDTSGSGFLRGIYAFRNKLEGNLYLLLPTEEAAFLGGVLLGNDSGLPAGAQSAFRETGTAHILAVSGFNISILVALLAALFRRILPRPWYLLPVVLGIALFSLMVGGQASVVRAALMGIGAQIGLALGRRSGGGNALIFTAAVMAFFNPMILGDIGFQLSFAATGGILLWGDRLTTMAEKWCQKLLPGPFAGGAAAFLTEFLLITLAAQIFTLPVSAYHFHSFSWVGLLANPLVLPVQQLVMVLGSLAVLLSLLFLPLGQIFAWLAWPFCAYTLAVVEGLARISSGAVPTGEVGPVFVFLYYVVLLSFPFYARYLLPFLRRAAPWAALLASLAGMLLIWRAYFVAPDGQLQLVRVDSPGRPAYFLTSPGGNRVLLDGLDQPLSTANRVSQATFPFPLRLDALLLTGEKTVPRKVLADFMGKIEVHQIMALPIAGKLPDISLADEPLSGVSALRTGNAYSLGKGATLTVLTVGADCADFEVVYNELRVWLAGCPLSDRAEALLEEDWSVVSLAQPLLGKSDVARLANLKSDLVLSRAKKPLLKNLPNWLTVNPGQAIRILSNGDNLSVGVSK